MSSTDTASTTLASLAVTSAGASRVFHRYGLDYCCGGNESLQHACERRGLDPDRILSEIADEERSGEEAFERWDEREPGDLIAHILKRFHETHREELPRLIEMAERVERVHADKPACPTGLAGFLRGMATELEDHMRKEEQILFPMVEAGRGGMAGGPVRVMEEEHRHAGENLRKLREVTVDFTPPPDACKTWTALYLGLAEFERDLMQHVHLENNVLFPRALAQSPEDS